MRISDWSSDVCSSDLPRIRRVAALAAGHAAFQQAHPATQRQYPMGGRVGERAGAAWKSLFRDFSIRLSHPRAERRERQRRGEGTSVSVRVDIGGSRIINKKIIKTTRGDLRTNK